MHSHVTVSNSHPDSPYPGGGPAYCRMWDLLDVLGKGEAYAAMEAAAVASRVKGSEHNKTVVKERTVVMGVEIFACGQGGYFPV